jgi:acyl-CoA synthetase (AMP-forming)/AMP-acid ligase II
MSITEVFRIHARQRGSKIALVDRELAIDYLSLDRLMNSAAWALHQRGVRRGDVVGVALKDTAHHVVILLALARLGVIIAPMDCRWQMTEKVLLAKHLRAKYVIVEGELARDQSNWLTLDDAWFAGDRIYEDQEITPDTLLLLSLSSGTTGKPKGPALTHRQYENRFMVYWIDLTFNAQDRFISATPLYFGGGRGFTLAMLFGGGTVYLFPPPFKPEELFEYVKYVRGTSIFLVPTMLRRLLGSEIEGLAFPTLQKLISSGSAIFESERRAVRERLSPHLFELYSSTEGGSISVLPPHDFELSPDSVGRPCFRVEVEVVDAEHRQLPAGEVGRLRYRSPSSATKYFIGEDEGAFEDGWFYPGDLGLIDEADFIKLRGRSKDMIIRGGVNIYPADIENALLQHSGVSEAAVIGVPAKDMGEEIAAFITISAPVTSDEIRSFCKTQLASYKVPKFVVILDSMPKSSLGKVLKSALPELMPQT